MHKFGIVRLRTKATEFSFNAQIIKSLDY